MEIREIVILYCILVFGTVAVIIVICLLRFFIGIISRTKVFKTKDQIIDYIDKLDKKNKEKEGDD